LFCTCALISCPQVPLRYPQLDADSHS
jgi:hypothetical protein